MTALVVDAIPLALYVHMPWCVKKCPYCDFNSHQITLSTLDEDSYIKALLTDLHQDQAYVQGRAISSLFIGGGTPSLFSGKAIARLLEGIRAQVTLAADAEITLEANPGSADAAHFAAYRKAGVNRLSLGIQSFADDQLRALGRVHDSLMAEHAIAHARAAGFENFNLDLMFGLPKQGMAEMRADLQRAIAYQPSHLSWYQLTLEPHTAFYHNPPTQLPDADALADMAEAGMELLAAAGYTRYEVSAFARDEKTAKHNLNYWYFGDYLGIGAGAHGKVTQPDGTIWRYAKHRQPERYQQAVHQGDFCSSRQQLEQDALPLEFFMNALRLPAGVPARLFVERTGLSFDAIKKRLDALQQEGLLEANLEQIRPTPLGLRFLNTLLERFA